MKVFISWSGDKSKAVALVVKWWLGVVHPAAKPWVSTVDIQAGDRWAAEIEKGLEGAAFGIICVTPQNVDSRWINYEAGAISKQVDGSKTKVAALLIDYSSPTELEMPLSQFNAVMPTSEGFQDLALSINSALDERDRREASAVRELADMVWTRLSQQLDEIEVQEPNTAPRKRDDSQLLEEVLLRVRGLDKRIDEITMQIESAEARFGYFDPQTQDALGRRLSRATLQRQDDARMATEIVRRNVPNGMNPRRVGVNVTSDGLVRIGTPSPLSEGEKALIFEALLQTAQFQEVEFFVHNLQHVTEQ